jgi:NADH dehydrogenase
MGLPLTPDGQVLVDECYRVHGVSGVYSFGDCTSIVDPRTGKADQMTCKEAGPQALRLGKIVMADLEGCPAPVHKSVMNGFAIGLGQDRGLVWTRKWGLDMILTGKLAWKIKKFAWDRASMLR